MKATDLRSWNFPSQPSRGIQATSSKVGERKDMSDAASPRARARPSHPRHCGFGYCVRGLRHRHRHSRRQAEDHLRGLPAGGCRHQSQVRRHRPGTSHQPRARQPAWWRNSTTGARRAPAAASRSTCRRLTSGPRPAVGMPASDLPHPPLLTHPVSFALPEMTGRNESKTTATTLKPGDASVADRGRRYLTTRAFSATYRATRALRCWSRCAVQRPSRSRVSCIPVRSRSMSSLPDMLGWTVLNHLKQDPATRHIPVQMLTVNEDWHHGLSHGAFAFVKQADHARRTSCSYRSHNATFARPRRKRLLVVEDEPGATAQHSLALLDYDDIDVDVASTGEDALAAMKATLRLRRPRLACRT